MSFSGDDVTKKTDFNCSICGSNHFKRLGWYNGWFSFKLSVAICRECGIVCLNPRMNEKNYEEYYRNNYYGEYQPKPTTDSEVDIRGEKLFDKILPHIRKDSNLLEVGCGPGGNLIALKNKGFNNIVGLDPSLDCCLVVQSHGIDCKNSGLLAYTNESTNQGLFDLIILNGVLEHFVEPDKYLNLISGLLKEKGLLYISVPNIHGFVGKYVHDAFTIPHTFYFSFTTLRNLLSINGFEIIKKFESEEDEISILVAKKEINEAMEPDLLYDEYLQVLKHLKVDRIYVTNFPKLTRRLSRAIGGQILRKLGVIN